MSFGIAVLGATGYIGTRYRAEIRAAGQGGPIVSLCARRQDRLAAAAQTDGATHFTQDWQESVLHPDVDLVLVLTPDALHYEPVMMCAEHNKHVFCEKPVGKDVGQAYQMWRAVEDQGLLNFVPFWTRYVPIMRRARDLIRQGKLGTLRAVVYRWHNPRPLDMPFTWRDDANQSSAGSVADVGSHAYDTLRFLLDMDAQRVLAHTRVMMPPKPDLGQLDLSEAITWGEQNAAWEVKSTRTAGVPDYAQLTVEFSNGAAGCILLSHAGYIRKGFAPEVEVHGTTGSLAVDRMANQLWFADSPEPARLLEAIEDDGYCNRFERHVFPALTDEQTHPDHPRMRDGWRVQIFTDAVVASAERKSWVELAEFDAEL
jgi:predicted dehydrogenase